MKEEFIEGADFGYSFIEDAIKSKYPGLYEMLCKKIAYLDWANTTLENAKIGNGKVSIYSKKSHDYLGTFSCNFKIYHDEDGEWYPTDAIKSSLKFKIEPQVD